MVRVEILKTMETYKNEFVFSGMSHYLRGGRRDLLR